MSGEGRTRLTSWKEIATYLRREVRTVIRWEKERGLPVHRVPGGQGRSVFAFTDELDRWAAGAAAEPAARPDRRWLRPLAVSGTIVTLAALAAAMVAAWPRADVARLEITRDGLTALSASSRPLWWFRFPRENAYYLRRQTAIADLTGDGHPDALASTDLIVEPDAEPAATLFAIDGRGRTLWSTSPSDTLTFGAGAFTAPWQPDDLGTFSARGAPRIAWTLHHYTWWPSLLAVFAPDGTRTGTFVNAGWLRGTRSSPDGRVLFAYGFSNSRDAAAFALLDADNPTGSSPEDAGSPYACRSCPEGRPLRYVTVQWTDVAAAPRPGDRDATVTFSTTGTIELRAMQRATVEAIVDLSPALEIVRASFSDNYWEWHRRLETDGTLKHSRAACPFREGPIVREWTPQRGWRAVSP